ncbi:MAG TPA: hypothetical protein VGB09_13040, partial [Candidatus Binatia bacterium]
MRKAFKDAEFHREYKNLTDEDPDPLMPEEMEKAIREMPTRRRGDRFAKKLSESPLPARGARATNCCIARPDPTAPALTDDLHIAVHAARWGIVGKRPTMGKAVAERTAAVIWSVLKQIETP